MLGISRAEIVEPCVKIRSVLNHTGTSQSTSVARKARGLRFDNLAQISTQTEAGPYFQRLMNAIVATSTTSGWVALRKWLPPSTMRSSASALFTKSRISSCTFATE